ncbi:hypothetical protein [Ottowia cancrivicina]|uniref:Uncharacterized protein n=1 Tax=Ottowia cancrivicina TaxID=3040346 RepID=A0AAW6RIG0_9BURK|nr:hypothetical protein [Ottowia sp. 10c7w1]MDG9698401.1 hypothetical protein [Ottowia sp. 10c7w1]
MPVLPELGAIDKKAQQADTSCLLRSLPRIRVSCYFPQALMHSLADAVSS